MDRSAIRAGLEQIMARGWAAGDAEHIPDGFGVAAPYFADGTVAGSVTAPVPRQWAGELDIPALATQLSAVASSLATVLSLWRDKANREPDRDDGEEQPTLRPRRSRHRSCE
ncbi:IclR family transcriptional regulator [Streptomyces flaveolus]|uniref:hypothetical protein n=1 Tax=Streptomyces flaveolus TaxID=67297 RepID=UPI00382C1218